MARLRIIQEAFKQLKQDDPETAITLCALRRIVKTGDIPAVRIGRKTLIDYDQLLQYLQTGNNHPDSDETETIGIIRRIA
ncbi:MAG: hypothetical protein ACOX6O_10565 [Christensenellales bacterium]|jgi:excisionase family DNA binding protein